MNLLPDLFSFAYVPGWYCQLDELTGLALPEPWRFWNPDYYTKNTDTPILKRYIYSIFKKQVIDFNEERNTEKAAGYLHVENEFVCFHTGLYTRRYKAIYDCFDWNKRQGGGDSECHHKAHMAVYGEKRPLHPPGHAEYPRRRPEL